MQIRGRDRTVTIGPQVTQELICGVVNAFWPDSLLVILPNLSADQEYFFFKTEEALNAWRNQGMTEEQKDTMIHVLHDHGQITFSVLEEACSETQWVVDQIIKQIL